MDSTLTQSLWITLISMGLVFVSLLLLAGLMSLMTRLFRDQVSASDSSEAAPVSDQNDLIRATVAAVTVALAEQSQSAARPITPATSKSTIKITAWKSKT
jgi:Na+-transporting methylmalonyl-CoA/oxaloacetate decarboxylase gamma subunit